MKVLLIEPYSYHSKGLNSGLGWLSASVKEADQYAGQVSSKYKIKEAFDTPDFTYHERFKALEKI